MYERSKRHKLSKDKPVPANKKLAKKSKAELVSHSVQYKPEVKNKTQKAVFQTNYTSTKISTQPAQNTDK